MIKSVICERLGIEKPLWCGWVTDAQYMYIRSLYASVPFEVKAETKEQKEQLDEQPFPKDSG